MGKGFWDVFRFDFEAEILEENATIYKNNGADAFFKDRL